MWEHAREIAAARELLRTLAARELKVRYRNSVLGFFWSFLNPLMMLAIYTFAFKYVLKVPVENFTVFLLSGLLPWSFLQTSLLAATRSIVDNALLVRKVYFPRAVLPLAAVLASMYNFLLTLGLLLVVTPFLGAWPGWVLLALPVVIAIHLCGVIGLGVLVATLNALYRDTLHLLEVAMGAWFFLTPVVYSLDLVPAPVRPWAYLNPMTTIIQMYRAVLFEQTLPPWPMWVGSAAGALALLAIGLAFLRYQEYRLAEQV